MAVPYEVVTTDVPLGDSCRVVHDEEDPRLPHASICRSAKSCCASLLPQGSGSCILYIEVFGVADPLSHVSYEVDLCASLPAPLVPSSPRDHVFLLKAVACAAHPSFFQMPCSGKSTSLAPVGFLDPHCTLRR